MTGTEVAWARHPNGRWIVGDAGNQPSVVAVPPVLVRRRPDVTLDGGRVGMLDYRAASLRGIGHLETGKPRQDSYVVTVTRDDHWLVGCVADGVSDGRMSHRAADLACEKLAAELIDGLAAGPAADLDRLDWAAGVAGVNAAIHREFLHTAKVEEAALADVRTLMSTTAVAFAVATQADADGTHRAVIASLAGDSAALVLDGDGWRPVTAVKGEGEEVASNAVRPLPREVEPEPVTLTLRPGDVLAVITDGIGDPLGGGGGVVGRFLAEQWAEPPDTIEFANQVGFYRKTFMDDRTVIAVWVAPEPT
ncbi:protein phosphatase 2C domain-containing protein [Actinoplanes flavus]|uniref:Protein phosphatase 2C domain-containing protein n=1 Tax=Actinoplanes flavus TaxID=2820290 RepID=A0ABS3UGB6_9ACTN|nr:protein phosphatase 2C domain-containing protein [Actinoplanes flavus]MBO3737811.1 protein phosphatase 2C domain-containing protein [Actinoplanes flavus]